MEYNADKSFLDVLVLTATLRGKYDEWIKLPNMEEILNTDTNIICINLKKNYPQLDEQTMQSIALAFTTYFYIFFCFIYPKL